MHLQPHNVDLVDWYSTCIVLSCLCRATEQFFVLKSGNCATI